MYKAKDNLFFNIHLAQANYSANEIKGAAFSLFNNCMKMSNGENQPTLPGSIYRIWFVQTDTKQFGCFENGGCSE